MAFPKQFMQKVPVFTDFKTYRLWARKNLFPHPVFKQNKQFSNLIDSVLYNRCPLFYWPEFEDERISYLGCYGIMPIVHPKGPYLGYGNRYSDPVITGLTHSHEFFHSLFIYPRSLNDMTEVGFNELMQDAEAGASNGSEVVIYYMIPELADLTKDAFFRPGWYDRLIEMGFEEMPKLDVLHSWRRGWIANREIWEPIFTPGEKYDGLRNYMRRFVLGNEDFNVKRLHQLLNLEGFYDPGFPGWNPNSYLQNLVNFTPDPPEVAQVNFERRQLLHWQLLYRLLGKENLPKTFMEACQRAPEFNNTDFVLNGAGYE